MSALATVHCLETWRVLRRLASYRDRDGWGDNVFDETPEWFAANAIDPAEVVMLGGFRAVVDDVRAAATRYGFRFVPAPAHATPRRVSKGGAR